MECTSIFGFGSYPPSSHMKFHQNSIQDSLQFSFHMPQNSTHSSPSNIRCQNQNQSSPFDTRCQMILILTLILDLAHCLHCWMMSTPQQLKNRWLMMNADYNNSNKRT